MKTVWQFRWAYILAGHHNPGHGMYETLACELHSAWDCHGSKGIYSLYQHEEVNLIGVGYLPVAVIHNVKQ